MNPDTEATTWHPHAVAEMQGLYAPFSFSEALLQKIWMRREFNMAGAATRDGRRLAVLNTGRWNRLGGPDFRDARLMLGETEVSGDVEVHLHEKDWDAHGHASDPAYNNVVLHVVLFEPRRAWTPGAGGRDIPVLVLLPLLHHGLEEYASEDAIETLAQQETPGPEHDRFRGLGNERVLSELHRHAERRWRHKVHFAKERIRRLGWDEACHFTALEILGYSRNRAPMLAVAAAHPLRKWTSAEGGIDVDALYGEQDGHWSLHGLRPLNHPRLRLKQYADATAACPDWTGRWRELADNLPEGRSGVGGTRAYRHLNEVAGIRERICHRVSNRILGGTRLDTLVCDGLLPLLSAETGRDFQELWWHWFLGDVPAAHADLLEELRKQNPSLVACHGLAQGMLGLFLSWEQEKK
ncbi:MAG: DUF2851 family protein [Opitutaceae bacterium]|jgi:hypothetical protein|nr:DUF2851 family protein [Opitutaceae bacterium]